MKPAGVVQRLLLPGAMLLLAIAAARPANASQVEVDKGNFHDPVYLTGSDLYLTDFHSSTDGIVSVKLEDIGFTELLQSVSVTLMNSLGKKLLTQDSLGLLSFEIRKDETLSLSIYAVMSGLTRHGMYTLDSSFVPTVVTQVPIPAAGWLLASALALLPGLRRRRFSGAITT